MNKSTRKRILSTGLFLLLFILLYEWYAKRPIKIIQVYHDLPRKGSYPSRSLEQIQQIIIHHSASPYHRAEDFARWHIARGWPGIGYHFVIEKDGRILQSNPLTTISNGASGENTKSIHIVLSGNFDVEKPSKQQLKSLKRLTKHLQDQLKRTLPISGHRDHGQTACPGKYLYAEIPFLA